MEIRELDNEQTFAITNSKDNYSREETDSLKVMYDFHLFIQKEGGYENYLAKNKLSKHKAQLKVQKLIEFVKANFANDEVFSMDMRNAMISIATPPYRAEKVSFEEAKQAVLDGKYCILQAMMKKWGELGLDEPDYSDDQVVEIAGRPISQENLLLSMSRSNSLMKSTRDVYTTDGGFEEGLRETFLGSSVMGDEHASQYQTVQWSCSECTFRNSYERDDCQMCGKARPEIVDENLDEDDLEDNEIPENQLLSSRIVLKCRYARRARDPPQVNFIRRAI